jgi:hypothetical protein
MKFLPDANDGFLFNILQLTVAPADNIGLKFFAVKLKFRLSLPVSKRARYCAFGQNWFWSQRQKLNEAQLPPAHIDYLLIV